MNITNENRNTAKPTDQMTCEDLVKALHDQLEAERNIRVRAESFIERQGYRRCDIPMCNCNSWHGGQDLQRRIGITLLDAKWLDPECHEGCKSIAFKQRADSAESALKVAKEELRRLRDVVSEVDAEIIDGVLKGMP